MSRMVALLHHPPAKMANKHMQITDYTPMTHAVIECQNDTAGQLLNRKMISDIYSQDTYEKKDIVTKVSKMENSLRKEALNCSGQSISLTLS